MTFKDLKEGMKVWIREDLSADVRYGRCYFDGGMQELTGLQTIEIINASTLTLKNGYDWYFTSEMIDWG